MEPIHILYKELVKIIFLQQIFQKEMRLKRFRKSQEYGVTGMTIKPDIGNSSLVKVTDESKLKFLSEKIQELVKNKKEPDLNLTISHGETKDLLILFQKQSEKDCSPIKLKFYNPTTTTTKKKKMKKLFSIITTNTLKSSVLNGKIQQLI